LSEAARKLAEGAPDIVSVALDPGFGSHGAFIRALGQQFGMTPENLQNRGRAASLDLVEAVARSEITSVKPTTVRIEDETSPLAARLAQRYSDSATSGMPPQ
jgi:AraC family transcriptional regulator